MPEPPEDLRGYLCIGTINWLGPVLELGTTNKKDSFEWDMSRACCIMLWPLVKKDFQTVRLSQLLGTSSRSFGNGNSLSLVVAFGTSPIGAR
jgi:hypothetical protein